MIAGASSAGGLSALIVKKFHPKNGAKKTVPQSNSKETLP